MFRTSLILTPAMLSVMDSEKNAMPNDIAKRGWRATTNAGVNIGPSHRLIASFHEPAAPAWACVRALARPVVAIKMLLTSLDGGSTSANAFNQRRPASASANNGPQTEQIGRASCRERV